MCEYGYYPMNDYQYFCHGDIPFLRQGIRRGPLSESDCSSCSLKMFLRESTPSFERDIMLQYWVETIHGMQFSITIRSNKKICSSGNRSDLIFSRVGIHKISFDAF